jgi:hypothetical protein
MLSWIQECDQQGVVSRYFGSVKAYVPILIFGFRDTVFIEDTGVSFLINQNISTFLNCRLLPTAFCQIWIHFSSFRFKDKKQCANKARNETRNKSNTKCNLTVNCWIYHVIQGVQTYQCCQTPHKNTSYINPLKASSQQRYASTFSV